MAADRLAFIDGAVAESIQKKELPGAVVLVARRGGVVWRKAYGARALVPAREEMTADTVFDLASLTKVVATSTSAMILVERGKLRLTDPVSRYIPELKGEGRERITVEHLLTHRSGYAPDFDLGDRWEGHEEMLKRLYVEPLRNAPGARFVYSDIGMIVARRNHRARVGRAARCLRAQEHLRAARHEGHGLPPPRPAATRPTPTVRRIAPTESVRGMKSYLGGTGDAGADGRDDAARAGARPDGQPHGRRRGPRRTLLDRRRPRRLLPDDSERRRV